MVDSKDVDASTQPTSELSSQPVVEQSVDRVIQLIPNNRLRTFRRRRKMLPRNRVDRLKSTIAPKRILKRDPLQPRLPCCLNAEKKEPCESQVNEANQDGEKEEKQGKQQSQPNEIPKSGNEITLVTQSCVPCVERHVATQVVRPVEKVEKVEKVELITREYKRVLPRRKPMNVGNHLERACKRLSGQFLFPGQSKPLEISIQEAEKVKLWIGRLPNVGNIEVLLQDALAKHSALVYAISFKECLLPIPSFRSDESAPKKNRFAYAWIPLSNLETVLSKLNSMHLPPTDPIDPIDPMDLAAARGLAVQIANQYHYRHNQKYNNNNKNSHADNHVDRKRSFSSKHPSFLNNRQEQPKFIGGRRWSASQQQSQKANSYSTSQYFKYPQNKSHTEDDLTDKKGWRRSPSEDHSRLLDLRNMCVYQRLMNPQDGSIVDRVWKTQRVGPPYKRFFELLSYQDHPTYIEADQHTMQHYMATKNLSSSRSLDESSEQLEPSQPNPFSSTTHPMNNPDTV